MVQRIPLPADTQNSSKHVKFYFSSDGTLFGIDILPTGLCFIETICNYFGRFGTFIALAIFSEYLLYRNHSVNVTVDGP